MQSKLVRRVAAFVVARLVGGRGMGRVVEPALVTVTTRQDRIAATLGRRQPTTGRRR